MASDCNETAYDVKRCKGSDIAVILRGKYKQEVLSLCVFFLMTSCNEMFSKSEKFVRIRAAISKMYGLP